VSLEGVREPIGNADGELGARRDESLYNAVRGMHRKPLLEWSAAI
jgi:hypothetical protein